MARGPTRFEETLSGQDVVAHIDFELAPPTAADARLAGQVIDQLHPIQQARKIGIDQAGLDQTEPRMRQSRAQVVFFGGAVIVVGKAVDPNDLATTSQQRLTQVRTDETRSSGHEHRVLKSIGKGRLIHSIPTCVVGFASGEAGAVASSCSRIT